MKIDKEVAAIFSVGVLVGSTIEWFYSRKLRKELEQARDRNYKLYEEQFEKANQLDLELRQCKLTNFQVAQYASQLKKQLDHFME